MCPDFRVVERTRDIYVFQHRDVLDEQYFSVGYQNHFWMRRFDGLDGQLLDHLLRHRDETFSFKQLAERLGSDVMEIRGYMQEFARELEKSRCFKLVRTRNPRTLKLEDANASQDYLNRLIKLDEVIDARGVEAA